MEKSDLVEGEEQDKEGEKLNSKLVTEKAARLLRVIAEHGYLTINEVGLIYRHQTHAYRVLKTLKEQGLVEEFDTQTRPKTGYFLRPKGYRTLRERGQLRLKRRFDIREFKPFIFNHRMACAKAGIILEDHALVRDFLPESLLWERRKDPEQKLCDGEFLFAPPGWERPRRVGLEVELTQKNSDKLQETFEAFIKRRDLDQVWWLCADAAIARALGPWIKRIRRHTDQRHFLGSFEDFLKDGPRFELHDQDGLVYSIAPEKMNLPESFPPEPPPPPRPEPTPTPPPLTPTTGHSDLAMAVGLQLKPPLRRGLLDFCRRWAEESWADEGRWNKFDWQKRHRFTRWPHVIITVVLLVAWAAALSYKRRLDYRETLGWRERTVLRSLIRDRRWAVQPLFLASRGHEYELGLNFVNEAPTACLVSSIRIQIPRGRVIVESHPSGNLGRIPPGTGLTQRVRFEESPRLRRVLAILTATGGRDCKSAVVPIDFN